MTKSPRLYMMTIVPPTDLEQKISQERTEFSEKYYCKAALKPPVHITLANLFKAEDNLEISSIEALEAFCGAQQGFELEVRNYGFFEHRHYPVVFIDVVKNEEIKLLNSELSRLLRHLFSLPAENGVVYHPHFTIGYRDLSPDIFPEVKRIYSERHFDARFTVDSLCLFKHNSVRWEVYKRFPFGVNLPEQNL
jgi:2'-5' RNA ligase